MFVIQRNLVYFHIVADSDCVEIARIVKLSGCSISPSGKKKWFSFDFQEKSNIEDSKEELSDLFSDCDLIGFNPLSFDIAVLDRELKSLGVVLDSNVSDIKILHNLLFQDSIEGLFEFYIGCPISDALKGNDEFGSIKASIAIFESMIRNFKPRIDKLAMIDENEGITPDDLTRIIFHKKLD